MRRPFFPVIMTVTAVTIAAFPVRRSAAADETNDVEIKIDAPLEASNCGAIPSTITVLGVDIDVSAARIDANASSSPPASPTPTGGGDDGGRRGQGGGSTPPSNCYYNFCTPPVQAPPTGCAALVVGQPVTVKLTSDQVPLIATDVQQDASSNHDVKLQAALQAFDVTAQRITLLGLAINVGGAGLDGADDDSTDGHSQPIDLSRLMVGQSVEVGLASSIAPLAATEVEVKNFANQLQVEVIDAHGNPVGDVDENGDPIEDVEVDVTQNVLVRSPTPDTSGARRTKVLSFHAGSQGSVTLRGLATARAKIVATGVRGGVAFVGRRTVRVKGNRVRPVRLRLRPVAAR